jgi:palmitoyl-protein thioesterase
MEEQPLYREDWIGLRELDEGGVVRRDWCEGAHMEIGGCWKEVLDKWVGTKTGSMGERGREIKSLGLVIQ